MYNIEQNEIKIFQENKMLITINKKKIKKE